MMMKRFGRSRKREETAADTELVREINEPLGTEPGENNPLDNDSVEPDVVENTNVEENGDVEHSNSPISGNGIIENEAAAALAAAQAEHASQVETLKAEVRENYDKYLRAVAELENVKKRAMKERSELLKYGGESLARDMLEVVDSLEMAIARDYPGANEEVLKGIKLVLDLFGSVFERHMIRGETAVGKPFDPEKHQAMTSVPTTEHPHNSVMQEFRKAYFFKDRMLRPAQVVVATNPSGEHTGGEHGTATQESAAAETESTESDGSDSEPVH